MSVVIGTLVVYFLRLSNWKPLYSVWGTMLEKGFAEHCTHNPLIMDAMLLQAPVEINNKCICFPAKICTFYFFLKVNLAFNGCWTVLLNIALCKMRCLLHVPEKCNLNAVLYNAFSWPLHSARWDIYYILLTTAFCTLRYMLHFSVLCRRRVQQSDLFEIHHTVLESCNMQSRLECSG